MIARIVCIIGLLGIVGCSAVGLNEQNQQATAQVEAHISGTVESLLATESADRESVTATLRVLFDESTQQAQALTEQADVMQTISAEQTQSAVTSTPDLPATVEQVEATLTAIAETTQDPESTDEPTPDTSDLVAEAEATLTAIAEITSEPEPTADPAFIPTSAGVSIFGTVPIDSDSLNSITALALDVDGNLLVSLRNGDIYRLQDDDNDNSADEVTLIFEDDDNDIGQVSGILADGALLYVLNGEQLSLLQDDDGDGAYDTVTTLSDELPQNQALLQANNSIINAGDNSYFTADVSSGDILLITVSDE